ncbi:hypothetical protein B7463_g3, partial [Scytalidium lignicola]
MSQIHISTPISAPIKRPLAYSSSYRLTPTAIQQDEYPRSKYAVSKFGITPPVSSFEQVSSAIFIPNYELEKTPPSKIPSPTWNLNPDQSAGAVSSTQISTDKENPRNNNLQLHGTTNTSASKARRSLLPKSRTMSSMFSGLKSSISEPSTHSNSHNNDYCCNTSYRGSQPPENFLEALSTESVEVTSDKDILHVRAAQPSSYWCGRFQAIHDRLGNELIQTIKSDSQIFQSNTSSTLTKPRSRHRFLERTKQDQLPPTISRTNSRLIMEDEEKINKIFAQLAAFCVTSEAERSLLDWQVDYCKKTGNSRLLHRAPYNTTIHGRWVSKIARAVCAHSLFKFFCPTPGVIESNRSDGLMCNEKMFMKLPFAERYSDKP